MKLRNYAFLLLLTGTATNLFAGNVKLTTSPVAADTLYQGTTNNIVYIVKMEATVSPATVNNIQYRLTGSHDADDFTATTVYFNSAPGLSGASYLGQSAANFAAPKNYSINVSRTLTTGEIGYFIITVNTTSSASDNKTVQINGATNPVTFGFTTATTVTNNQNNGAGLQTIQAAEVTLSTTTVSADTLYQGSSNNFVYIAKMDVSAMSDVWVNSIQYTLSGNHDANDLTVTTVYYNTNPSIIGASYLGQSAATFAAPNAYNINIYKNVARGTTGYFIITVNVNSSATDNKTVRLNGSANPVVFGYTTSPNVTNTQTNGAGLQTIQAAEVTLSTTTVSADTLYQGSSNNFVYIAKMDVSAMSDVWVNSIQYTLSGNHDANDLTVTTVYYNTNPSIIGASYLGQSAATFAAPNAYNINIYKNVARGTTGYFIITVNVNSSATDNKTVRLNGIANPVVFGYTTSPNVTNTQTNGAGLQTIQAAEVTLSSVAVSAGNIARGSNNNIIYITKMDVSAMNSVLVNNIQYTLSGTHDADDLTITTVYYNTTPSIIGASYLGQSAATFAAPHVYSINLSKTMTRGTTGYFIISVNVNTTATLGRTVQINGLTNPVVFTYSTVPNSTNNQTNTAGIKTITATSPVSLMPNENNNQNNIGVGAISIKAVYPNPVTDILHIEVEGEARILISNELGYFIEQKIIRGTGVIDMKQYKPGTYILKNTESGYSTKVIKQ
jgi:hypothetical protein